MEQIRATKVDFVNEYQNLNSGSLLTKGRNSSFALVGNSGPPSSTMNNSNEQILKNNFNQSLLVKSVLKTINFSNL